MSLAIDPLIRLQGVSRIFHTDEVETHALSRIDLEIRAGEYLAVCGPSGCGKTTLLSILGLLDSPSEGSYVLAGEPVSTLSAAQRARVRARAIGFIFQAFNLIGDLNVYENVELPLTLPRHARGGAAGGGARGAGAGRPAASPPALPGAAVGRPAAARRRGARGRGTAAGAPGRRADRQPRFHQRRRGHGAAARAERRRARRSSIVTHDPRYLREARRTVYLFDGRLVPGVPGDREVA